MNCYKAKLLIMEYLDGELPPEEKARLDEHLADCDDCRREFDTQKALVQRVRSLPRVAAPANFADNVRQNLISKQQQGRSFNTFFKRYGPMAASILIVVGSLSIWASQHKSGNDDCPPCEVSIDDYQMAALDKADAKVKGFDYEGEVETYRAEAAPEKEEAGMDDMIAARVEPPAAAVPPALTRERVFAAGQPLDQLKELAIAEEAAAAAAADEPLVIYADEPNEILSELVANFAEEGLVSEVVSRDARQIVMNVARHDQIAGATVPAEELRSNIASAVTRSARVQSVDARAQRMVAAEAPQQQLMLQNIQQPRVQLSEEVVQQQRRIVDLAWAELPPGKSPWQKILIVQAPQFMADMLLEAEAAAELAEQPADEEKD